jgi:MFS superfamily sulfate permease-like transporter
MKRVTLPALTTIELLGSGALWMAAVELALIASAETLLCTAALDRMHSGPRTSYDRELVAQGMGNSVCGLLGALPMTAVIVRSTANLRAGAQTRASTMLHGAWLLLLVALAPQLLRLVPVASLAAVLIVVGCRLIDPAALAELRRVGRPEAVIYIVTMAGVVTIDLLNGVLAGLAVAAVVLLHRLTHLRVDVEHDAGSRRSTLHLHGSATFLRLPKLADALEEIPPDREVHVHLDGLHHLDHAALELLTNWERTQRERGSAAAVDLSDVPSTTGRVEGEH